MLYVFIVSSGSILKFDMNLAVKKVSELKAEIERTFQIPVEDQVLLCSGGEELQDENIVGNYYGAGTDTNPIFLFRKYITECDYSFNVPSPHTSIDLSIEDDVYGCANMTPSSSTATVRAALAQRFADAAVKGRRECDELVHAQHLQQQGWAAVIANLEDGKDILLKRKIHCEELFLKYLAKRSHFQEVIKTFPDDIELLAKIPLSPKLLLGSDYLNESNESERTLLSWICTQPRTFLDSLIEKCQRSLEELHEQCLSDLNEDVAAVLRSADNPDIKEVKGIEDRLSKLNKQIELAKKYEKEQRDLAAWFSHTQSRMSRDPTVLHDLCGTFQKQLLLMLDNHKCLRGILDKCTKAKQELSESINFRIKYISRVESEMYGLQLRIKFLEKYVQSVTMQIESFEQVHLAPKRYVQLLGEAFRRRLFSTNYMKWATEVSALTSKLYLKEISIRKSFDNEDSKNIVDNLFPGMEDVPPPFAIECPKPFDQNLPPIMLEDLEVLKNRFPELAHFCEVPPPDPMPYISHPETDSAFSSNVPSSKMVEDSVDSGERNLHEKEQSSPQKQAPLSGDYSSLPSEYASMPNEVFSLTSSPFEDPLLPNSQLDSASKRTKLQTSETLTEKVSSPIREVESDGEEFETVDRCGPTIEIRSHSSGRKRSASAPRPNSTSEVININKMTDDKSPKLSKARSDGDAISPIQERLKSESLLASTDFQSTEYYIDDSMPSSYTESNATSPLLRSSRMVKSHHVVVAELQKQVDDKNGALAGAASSLKNSRCNILKLHAKISALQKFIHEMQGSLQSDLSNLKTYVKEEFWERMSEVSQIVGKINETVAELQKQTLVEKEEAVNKAKTEAKDMEMEYLKRLEVECQKLSDAENQIHNYEDYLLQNLQNLEEIKQENQMLEKELNLKKEVIKSMMLEHELELDSLRNQVRLEIQAKDDEIFKLTQNHSESESIVQDLQKEKECLAEDLSKQIKEKEALSSLLASKEEEWSEQSKELVQLKEEIKCLQDEKESNKFNAKYEEEIHSLQLELENTKQKYSEKLQEIENSKAQELKELEDKLTAKHRSEIESLRSRYKLAVSTTAMEKSTIGTVENLDSETAFSPEDLKKVITESREKWESEKNEHIQALIEEHEKKLKEAVTDAVNKENVKCNAEKMRTIVTMRKECEESIEKSKSRLVAELQVSFNEAINSVTKEKDVIIEGLRSKVSEMESKLRSISFHVENYSSQHSNEPALSQSDSGASCSYKVLPREEDRLIEKLKAELESYLNTSDQRNFPGPSQDDQTSECLRRAMFPNQNKLGLCIDCTFKISILSCDVGDLILLCYENKYDSFVAFHLSQFLHLLHSDCLQPLGLKIPAGPTERWALGVVTNKEFCVAKKASNRYKMNVGTKFYRIKVKPWDREKALRDYTIHRNSQSSAYSSRTLTPQSSASEEVEGAKGMSASSI